MRRSTLVLVLMFAVIGAGIATSLFLQPQPAAKAGQIKAVLNNHSLQFSQNSAVSGYINIQFENRSNQQCRLLFQNRQKILQIKPTAESETTNFKIKLEQGDWRVGCGQTFNTLKVI